jgi:peptidoglycan hydrolase-like protein with peptidoglycan-binding domain
MTIAALVAGAPAHSATGPAIIQLQLALKAVSHALTGTGYFGPATEAAVKNAPEAAGRALTVRWTRTTQGNYERKRLRRSHGKHPGRNRQTPSAGSRGPQ